jgi:hypothetical protein
LAAPRPVPLEGATRVSVAPVQILGDLTYPADAPVPAELGLSELVIAGLLRRADVQLVERRRFGAAFEAERRGEVRPPQAPPVGVSPGSELTASLVWVTLGVGGASLEVRLVETATGSVAGTRRVALPTGADPVGLARAAVGAIVAVLGELDRLPSWDDPVGAAASSEYAATDVSPRALSDFLSGLAAEERWQWERARAAYQSAGRTETFYEARAALARTARLRLGGSLGES